MIDGEVVKTMNVRFGGSATPTREGEFRVEYKSRDHVSKLYGSAMPFAMFFSRGQAVHYSSDFASVGYNGAVMVFGGFAPFIATFLIRETGSPIAPSYYVVFCAACSLLALSLPLKTYRTSQGN